MKVVTDTNVYVSALVFRGVTMRILDETVDVTARAKFHLTSADVQEAASIIREITRSVEPKAGIDAVKADATDNRVIECAIEAGADVIVSGDKHLLMMKSYAGICCAAVLLLQRDFWQRSLQMGRPPLLRGSPQCHLLKRD